MPAYTEPMGAFLAFGSVIMTVASIVVLAFCFSEHWRRRRAAIRALETLFAQKTPAELKGGSVVLAGIARPKKSSDAFIARGHTRTDRVQRGRSQVWERVETVVESKSFDLLLESGEKVRIVLGKKASFVVETAAREASAYDRRITDWEVRAGEDVRVEGRLSRDQGKGRGYRDDKGGWVMRSDVEPTIVRTRGAIYEWERTQMAPPVLRAIGIALIAFCGYGAVDLAMVESSMVSAEGVASTKPVERQNRKGERKSGVDMTVTFKTAEGHTRICGPIRGDGVAEGERVAIRYSKTDRDRCLRAASYGRGDIDIAYFVASLVLISGAAAMLMTRRDPWIGALPWFRRKR